MAMQPTLKKMRNLALTGCFILAASACSGSDSEDIEEAVQNEETPDELAAEGSEGVEETGAADAAAEAEAEAARAAAEAEAAENEAAAQATAEQEAAEKAAAAAAASASVADPAKNKGKRVWYVRAHNLPAYASPDGKGAPVRVFARGDHILARVQGAWAEISGGVWVRSRDLSRTPVGRHKSRASWGRSR